MFTHRIRIINKRKRCIVYVKTKMVETYERNYILVALRGFEPRLPG